MFTLMCIQDVRLQASWLLVFTPDSVARPSHFPEESFTAPRGNCVFSQSFLNGKLAHVKGTVTSSGLSPLKIERLKKYLTSDIFEENWERPFKMLCAKSKGGEISIPVKFIFR